MKEITKLRLFAATCVIVVVGLLYCVCQKDSKYLEKEIRYHGIKYHNFK